MRRWSRETSRHVGRPELVTCPKRDYVFHSSTREEGVVIKGIRTLGDPIIAEMQTMAKDGFRCSQIMLALGLKRGGRENPELIPEILSREVFRKEQVLRELLQTYFPQEM